MTKTRKNAVELCAGSCAGSCAVSPVEAGEQAKWNNVEKGWKGWELALRECWRGLNNKLELFGVLNVF